MRVKPQRPSVATIKSQPAPVGGLNVLSAINFMPQTDAIDLTNWIATQYGVRTRKGWREWVTGMTDEVRTIMEWAPDRSLTTYKLFASTDNNIYDVTLSTNVPVVSLALAGTDGCGRFSSANMQNSAGDFLLIAAHTGGYKYYDGAAWATPTFGGGAGQVSGCDPAKFSYVQMWKRRAWFHEKGTANVWYLAADSITGVATKFDVGPQLEHGGIISFIARWTIDAGTGVDDYLVIGGENGDIVIYKGTDPASSSTFGIVGVWYVGKLPTGKRASIQYGGDLLVLTSSGLQPLSYVTRGGQSLLRSSAVDYLKKIQPLFSDLMTVTIDQEGWEMGYSLNEGLLIVSTPPNSTTTYEQYALNTNTNTWCKFTNMNMATLFCGIAGSFYATTDGKLMEFLTGYFDNVLYGTTTGNGIAGVIQPAYNYYGSQGTKQFQMVRPTFLAADRPNVTISMVVDYQQNILAATPLYVVASGAKWDTALWDAAVWGGALVTYNDWYAAGAIGFAGSPYLYTICVADTLLASIDVMYEPVQNGPQI